MKINIKNRPAGISARLRWEIEHSGESRYAICKATGIDKAAMSRFMAGTTNLSLEAADRLAEHFGLELAKRSKRKGR